jgi:toxin ParE1/3/4
MADRLEWSPEAIEDIESVASYIERASPRFAQAVVSKIMDDCADQASLKTLSLDCEHCVLIPPFEKGGLGGFSRRRR